MSTQTLRWAVHFDTGWCGGQIAHDTSPKAVAKRVSHGGMLALRFSKAGS